MAPVRGPQDAGAAADLQLELLGPGAGDFVAEYELAGFRREDAPGEREHAERNGQRSAPRYAGELPARDALQALQLIVEAGDAERLRATARPFWLFTPRWNGAETPRGFDLQGLYSVLLASLPPVDSHGASVIVFPHQRDELASIFEEVAATARSRAVGLATWPTHSAEGPTDGRELYYWRLG